MREFRMPKRCTPPGEITRNLRKSASSNDRSATREDTRCLDEPKGLQRRFGQGPLMERDFLVETPGVMVDGQSPRRVCMVALHALPAIDPSVARPVGGTETRAWTFARGLAQRECCDVSFVVRADRPREPFQQESVTIVP